jgi:hypothetical protein
MQTPGEHLGFFYVECVGEDRIRNTTAGLMS